MTEFSILLDKYLNETLTAQEFVQFRLLLNKQENQTQFKYSLEAALENLHYVDLTADVDKQALYQNIIAGSVPVAPIVPIAPKLAHKTIFMYTRRWVAAAIIGIITVGMVIFWSTQQKATETPVTRSVLNDIAPGKEGATLTLADGSQILLDSMENRKIAHQNGSDVVLINGQLAYAPTKNPSGEVVFNTMSTPKGRQFQVSLPDGTTAWLNAHSSIRYPTLFTGKVRKVYITGEVYFEVAQNAKMPFIVHANNRAEIEVLGTQFNINAYDNETTINTTLIGGSIAVGISGQESTKILQPGQQAQIKNNSGAIWVSDAKISEAGINIMTADTDKVVAWKNGTFNFEGDTLEEAMRQLERWYDIDVRYEQGTPAIRFIGKIKKNISLNTMLKILEKSGVHCKLQEERLLVVMP